MILVEHRGERADMEEALLIGPLDGGYEDEDEIVRWYEQYLCRCHGEVVKRSVHVTLKRSVALMGEVGSIG